MASNPGWINMSVAEQQASLVYLTVAVIAILNPAMAILNPLVAFLGMMPAVFGLARCTLPYIAGFMDGDGMSTVNTSQHGCVSFAQVFRGHACVKDDITTEARFYLPAAHLNNYGQRRCINNQWDGAPGGRFNVPRVPGPTISNQDGANWLNWRPEGFTIPPFAK